jgi:predicted RNA binding protein YcfA (HicA-like mRNA interferase family)
MYNTHGRHHQVKQKPAQKKAVISRHANEILEPIFAKVM